MIKSDLATIGVAALMVAACGGGSGEQTINPTVRQPFVAQRIALPAGATAVAVQTLREGGGVIALSDGRIVQVNLFNEVSAVDRVPGETVRADDLPVSQFADRGGGVLLAIVPSGALLVQNGLVRASQLPMFLASARAFTRFGSEALWATNTAVFTSEGDRWLQLDMQSGAVANTTELASFDSSDGRREAWVHTGDTVKRLRFAGGAMPQTSWSDVVPTADIGVVRNIGAMDRSHGAIAGERGVAVVGADGVHLFRGGTDRGAPVALAAGGGWAWVAWGSALLRTDGTRWESLVQDMALGANTRISVDSATGSSALVIDSAGALIRVDAEETLRLSGLADGTLLFDTRIELEAVPMRTMGLESITFTVDAAMMPITTRMAAPWGIGDEGARRMDLSGLAFGHHSIDILATYMDHRTLRRSVGFDYVSPLGRTPSYATDIAPIFAARCARCHANGVARDLSGFANLRNQALGVRAAVRENRMPPDLLLDAESTATITAWVDGMTPP